MLLSYVEHLYKYYLKKLRKPLEQFFGKKKIVNRFTPISPYLDLL